MAKAMTIQNITRVRTVLVCPPLLCTEILNTRKLEMVWGGILIVVITKIKSTATRATLTTLTGTGLRCNRVINMGMMRRPQRSRRRCNITITPQGGITTVQVPAVDRIPRPGRNESLYAGIV